MSKYKTCTYRILILLSVFLFIGCSLNNDPMKDIDFGNQSRKSGIEMLLENGTIKIDTVSKFNSFDRLVDTIYPYIINDKLGEIELIANFNEEKFKFGKLIKLELEIPRGYNTAEGDTLSYLSRVTNIYSSWYGVPDTINESKLLWESSNYNISVPIENSSKRRTRAWKGNSGLFLTYEIKNYIDEKERLYDSIIENQSIDHLISPSNVSGRWKNIDYYENEFSFNVNFWRYNNFDERSITSVRFTVAIIDEFKKQLYKSPDITLEMNYPLYPQNNKYLNQSNDRVVFLKYNKNHPDFRDLENAKIYASKHKVEYEVTITAIAFDDGTVLNR